MVALVQAERIVCPDCKQIHDETKPRIYEITDEVCPSTRAMWLRERELSKEHGDRQKNPEWWAGRQIFISGSRPRPKEE